jgi:hypothetical protein
MYAGIDWKEVHMGERNHWSELAYLEHDAALLASAHGLFSMVESYERRLGRLTEELLAVDLAVVRDAARLFRRVEVDFLRLSGDAIPFVTSLGGQSGRIADAFRYWRGTDFICLDARRTTPWYDTVIENILRRTRGLRTKIGDTSTVHAAVSTALTTRANLRLQRQVAVLTYLLVFLTLLTAVFAALAARHDIREVFERLF